MSQKLLDGGAPSVMPFRMPSTHACTMAPSAMYGLAVASLTRNSTLNWLAAFSNAISKIAHTRNEAPRSRSARLVQTGAQRLGRRRRYDTIEGEVRAASAGK